MKVLKRGHPLPWTKEVTCYRCKAELELEESDMTPGFGDMGPFIINDNLSRTGRFTCPECNNSQKTDIPELLYQKMFGRGQT